MEENLTNVQRLWATEYAFLALRADGQLVAWGAESAGGLIPTALEADLALGVADAAATDAAFAVLLTTGRETSFKVRSESDEDPGRDDRKPSRRPINVYK